jgi:hypothetical protein
MWHGEEGRGVPAPPDIPSEYLKPYPRKDEALGAWSPPKELRDSTGIKAKAKAPEIVALRQARNDGATRFEVVWKFRDGVTEREVFSSVGWAERKVAELNQEQGVWRTIYRTSRRPRRFQERPEDVQVHAYWARSENMQTCLCPGQEEFLPTRPNQRYVNDAHRQRAYRARTVA